MKRCAACGRELPATSEYFHACSKSGDGLRSRCKECRRPQSKTYYDEHREQIIQRVTLHTRETLEERKAYWRARYQKNSAEFNAKSRKRYQENKDEILVRIKAYRERNRDAIKIAYRVKQQRRRRAPGHFTSADIELKLKNQKGRCWWCGKSIGDNYHVDHVVPISKGGTNDPRNLVIACPDCNQRKYNKLPGEWIGRLL